MLWIALMTLPSSVLTIEPAVELSAVPIVGCGPGALPAVWTFVPPGWTWVSTSPPEVPAGVAAVLHGHTHVPRDEMIGGVRWLNPGCITRPRGPDRTFAWLTVKRGKLTSWELVRISAEA